MLLVLIPMQRMLPRPLMLPLMLRLLLQLTVARTGLMERSVLRSRPKRSCHLPLLLNVGLLWGLISSSRRVSRICHLEVPLLLLTGRTQGMLQRYWAVPAVAHALTQLPPRLFPGQAATLQPPP